MTGIAPYFLFFFPGAGSSGVVQPTQMTSTIQPLPGDPDPGMATIAQLSGDPDASQSTIVGV